MPHALYLLRHRHRHRNRQDAGFVRDPPCAGANRRARLRHEAGRRRRELRDGEVWHNDDADLLAPPATSHLPQNITTPYLLRKPCAHRTSPRSLEGVAIEPVHHRAYAEVVGRVGRGGGRRRRRFLRAVLNDDFDTANWPQQLNLPVILVVGCAWAASATRC
jgi:hypothetical protein